jgi:hypothetical protein
MEKQANSLTVHNFLTYEKGNIMKKTISSPEDQLTNKVVSAICELNVVPNESKLKIDDYQKLLVSHFVNHVKVENHGLNEDEYMYRDGYVISTMKESLSSIRFEAEYWKTKLRSYKVALVRDKNGFSFSLIVFPRDIHTQIDSEAIKGMTDSLNDCFYTETIEEKYRTVFKLVPRAGTQTELMKSKGVPMFALSIGLELDSENKKFEILFYSNDSDRIDSLGNYREFCNEKL